MPGLEAQQSDLLPIVSKGTVLEEIVGSDGILVDPMSIDSMAQGLQLAASMDGVTKSKRIARIEKYHKRYSLENFPAAWSRLLDQQS